jgi:hypothetical protein
MHIHGTLTGLARRIAALSFLALGTATLTQAQQSQPAASSQPAPLLLAADTAPAALDSSSSSSSSDAIAASDSEARFDLSSAALAGSQPPPRRHYGRPNYQGGNTNADGSEKWTFLAGAGFGLPIGNTHKYETTGYVFQVGGGRNFNKTIGVLAQFDYNHFGIQQATLDNQLYIYNYCTAADEAADECYPEGEVPAADGLSQLGGNNHVWSFTLNPTFTLPTSGSLGAYVVVGGGFYHKVTNFTTPETAEECYYYCEEIEANANIDHYTSNAFGLNGGVGVTWKFSHFSNEKFYAEARYVLVLDSQRTGVTAANVASSSLTATDFYPANSNRTTYIPVTFGLRF